MSEEQGKPKEFKLEILADDAVAMGVYANFIIANQSETEFTLDFIFVPPQTNKAKIRSRVILNPTHTKRLNQLLTRQIEVYERRFGEIPLTRTPSPEGSSNSSNEDMIN